MGYVYSCTSSAIDCPTIPEFLDLSSYELLYLPELFLNHQTCENGVHIMLKIRSSPNPYLSKFFLNIQ